MKANRSRAPSGPPIVASEDGVWSRSNDSGQLVDITSDKSSNIVPHSQFVE